VPAGCTREEGEGIGVEESRVNRSPRLRHRLNPPNLLEDGPGTPLLPSICKLMILVKLVQSHSTLTPPLTLERTHR
jgi:hypothetical protein